MGTLGEFLHEQMAHTGERYEKVINGHKLAFVNQGIGSLTRVYAERLTYELGETKDKEQFLAILGLIKDEGSWFSRMPLDDVRDLILLSNESLGLLGDIKIKWLNEWFDEQKQQKQDPPPEVQPSPSVQATAKYDAEMPDYSHMESFTPTIPFDMSVLYSFLIEEKVIRNIDEHLFTNCITHANMNELFNDGVKSKLKLVITHLKSHYPKRWLDVVCSNFGCTKQEMAKFNVPKRKDFERKMTMLG